VLAEFSAARVHFALGRWDEAEADLDSLLAWHDSGGTSWADAFAFRAQIAVHRGQLAQARQDVATVEHQIASGGTCTAIDHFMLAQAFVLEYDRQVEKAVEVLRVAWQIAEDVPLAMAKPNIGPHLTRWSMAIGDTATAARVAADLRRLADVNPRVARFDAAAKWAAGLAHADTSALLDAVAILQKEKRPLQRAFVCEDAAAVLAASGALDESRTLLHEAIEQYEWLLASHRAASAQARLRPLGVRLGTRRRPRRPHEGWEGLTDAELRTAALVAKRLSNPEIAERLVVSRRTVESHVSHALAKLGLTSRGELAAEVLKHET
jgi:DNA-binding CsgD family transcriptional regulator